MPKITKISLHLLKLCRKNSGLFFFRTRCNVRCVATVKQSFVSYCYQPTNGTAAQWIISQVSWSLGVCSIRALVTLFSAPLGFTQGHSRSFITAHQHSLLCRAERCSKSVYPSITCWHCQNDTIMRSSLEDSPMSLPSSCLTSSVITNVQREPSEQGCKGAK